MESDFILFSSSIFSEEEEIFVFGHQIFLGFSLGLQSFFFSFFPRFDFLEEKRRNNNEERETRWRRRRTNRRVNTTTTTGCRRWM
jgi:hypothetical protein